MRVDSAKRRLCLGGDGLVGGGGLTSKVATGVTWWRRLNLEGGDRCYLVEAA